MSEDLTGVVSLDLSLDGANEPGTDGAAVARTEGATHITGSATSDYGRYDVDLTR